jgi:hypothetical protein
MVAPIQFDETTRLQGRLSREPDGLYWVWRMSKDSARFIELEAVLYRKPGEDLEPFSRYEGTRQHLDFDDAGKVVHFWSRWEVGSSKDLYFLADVLGEAMSEIVAAAYHWPFAITVEAAWIPISERELPPPKLAQAWAHYKQSELRYLRTSLGA